MLRSTFIHLPRIGATKERALWSRGFLDWRDVREGAPPVGWNPDRWVEIKQQIETSEHALAVRDAKFFETRMLSSEAWRFYDAFAPRAAFVDIETTGYGGMNSPITMVGVYDGAGVRQFVDGIDLHEFEEYIEPFELLVTYNGKSFDVPILLNRFPRSGLERKGHVDLRYVFAALGFKGGLKRIERQLGIVRPGEVAGMDGYAAVICWQRYKRGCDGQLDVLKRYNAEDVLNLKPLCEMACAMARQKLVCGTPLKED